MSGRPPYRVDLSSAAKRSFERLPIVDRTRLLGPMLGSANEPFPVGAVRMSGSETWRIRVGELRVLYRVDQAAKVVVIHRVARRNEATYRRIRESD